LKDCDTVALITLSLFISAVFYSAGDSYSQLYNPHGVKILSPAKEQEVSINIQNFTVEGVSTDNSTNNCDVSLLLNGITPYAKVSSKEQNGPNDFSAWERIFDPNLHLNVGENKLTARLLCSDDNSGQITKYHSVNFTGTNETSSTPITKVLNSPSTRDNISPTNITEIDESESISSDVDDQTEVTSKDQLIRNITSGPVIIPPSEDQEAAMLDSSPVNDSVIIPNATNSGSASDNGTSPAVIIPPSEDQETSTSHPAPVNNQSYSRPNQVSKEIIEPQETRGEENDDIPLIFPTPSPRVTFDDDDRDNSIVDSSVQDLSPVIKVENNNTMIEEGSLIMLNATQSYSHVGPIVSNNWKQLTNHPLEYIEGLNMPILKFKAPYVSQDTPLEFEISVSDTHGKSSSGIAHILVSDVASLTSKTNTASDMLNRSISEQHSGAMTTNVKIPDSSESNFSGSPSASNSLATQSKNQSQTTVASNSSARGDENGTSVRTIAGVDQIVNEGMEVILSGDSTSTNNSQLSYEWKQVGGDVKVSIVQQNAKQISFQAPEVNKDSKLTFRFIASADGTQISSDEVTITINDILQNHEKNESTDSQDGEISDSKDDDDDDNN
jgi:hypothetical protein